MLLLLRIRAPHSFSVSLPYSSLSITTLAKFIYWMQNNSVGSTLCQPKWRRQRAMQRHHTNEHIYKYSIHPLADHQGLLCLYCSIMTKLISLYVWIIMFGSVVHIIIQLCVCVCECDYVHGNEIGGGDAQAEAAQGFNFKFIDVRWGNEEYITECTYYYGASIVSPDINLAYFSLAFALFSSDMSEVRVFTYANLYKTMNSSPYNRSKWRHSWFRWISICCRDNIQ